MKPYKKAQLIKLEGIRKSPAAERSTVLRRTGRTTQRRKLRRCEQRKCET